MSVAQYKSMKVLRLNTWVLIPIGVGLVILCAICTLSQSSVSPLFDRRKHEILEHNWSVLGKNSPLEGPSPGFKKPDGLKVVGLVFYGRRETVSILDCYLQVSRTTQQPSEKSSRLIIFQQRNLAINGGFLDEVVFITRTNDLADLLWLDARVAGVPQYRRQMVSFEYKDYSGAYDEIEPDVLYIKIDDDIVFIEDTAIPSIVETKLEHPEYFLVSANMINQSPLSWVHRHLGALIPYLPELTPPFLSQNVSQSQWRASHLPKWEAPPEMGLFGWMPDDFFSPPFEGHRWLPLAPGTQGSPLVDHTPVKSVQYTITSINYEDLRGWWWWPAGAQLHYSFLSRIEDRSLWRYKFRTWDFENERLGIQFIAIWGSDIIASKPIPADDEYHLSIQMPLITGRRK